VSADPATHLDALGHVRDAIGTVRAVHGEYAEFFSGVFARLESVSGAVKVRQQASERELDELRQKQHLWEQERAVLEHELEAVRNRAAELSSALAQQRRDAELQQNQWAAELKGMRKALQQVAHRLAERGEKAPEAASPGADRPPGTSKVDDVSDPVLNSVMAQFEILQNDVARRRTLRQS
jgi:chromosome segregation ATPase